MMRLGKVVHEGPDDTSCLYVTRGYQEISLNRKSDCIPDTSGLWRCDIADYNNEIQSLYIYIEDLVSNIIPDIIWIIIIGTLHLEYSHFILQTEPSVSPPEFSIICPTCGGLTTTVFFLGFYLTMLYSSTEVSIFPCILFICLYFPGKTFVQYT